MGPDKIMIIRHAEKPDDAGTIAGVTENGQQDPEDLTIQGWQRAGALARFFNPISEGVLHPALAVPTIMFASNAAKHSKSLRPQHTILPLSRLLKLPLNLDHAKGEELALAQSVLSSAGIVLISWQHEMVPTIVNAITGNQTTCPQHWPRDRFDMVWVLDPHPGGWQLTQVPQMLLDGDRTDPIPNVEPGN